MFLSPVWISFVGFDHIFILFLIELDQLDQAQAADHVAAARLVADNPQLAPHWQNTDNGSAAGTFPSLFTALWLYVDLSLGIAVS